MEMSGEGNEELQKTVTPPWTFSFPKKNACKYAFNLSCNLGFLLFSIDKHDHVFTLMFYIAYAYGKMMKVAALFYLHEVIHVLANCSL
jgi:hypothetical protein